MCARLGRLLSGVLLVMICLSVHALGEVVMEEVDEGLIFLSFSTPSPDPVQNPALIPTNTEAPDQLKATAAPKATATPKVTATPKTKNTATPKATATPKTKYTATPEPTAASKVTATPLAEPEATYYVYENPETQTDAQTLTLSFVGDCSIGDTVKAVKKKNSMTGMIADNGDEWLFSTVSDIFHADDFTFANLESVLTDNMAPLYPLKTYNLVGPSSHREVLRVSGIDGLNTVNNHCIDFKYSGYEDTLANLEAVGLIHFGTLNPARTTNRYVHLGRIEIKGVRIGVTGYAYPVNDNTIEYIRSDIAKLREEGCQIVIVSLHWGTEEQSTPNKGQFPFAKKILDAGADMIWGHHPHVLQPVYFCDGKPIFFSTGNFVFGTIKSLDPASGIFQLSWDIHEDGTVSLASFHMIPTEMRHNKEYRPLLLEDQAAQEKCLKHIMGKARDGYDELPDGFEKTGTVYIDKDGSLSLHPIP